MSVRAAAAVASAANAVGGGTVAFGTFGSPHHYGLTDLIRSVPRAIIPGRASQTRRPQLVDPPPMPSAPERSTRPSSPCPSMTPAWTSGPLFTGEVVLRLEPTRQAHAPSGRPSRRSPTGRSILYEAYGRHRRPDAPTALPHARRQPASSCRPRIEVESAETALELAARGTRRHLCAAGPAGRPGSAVLEHRASTRPWSTRSPSSPERVRLRPVQAFVDRVATHLLGWIV